MSLYLSIAGFVIRISFMQTEWLEKRGLLIKLIQEYLSGFIIKKQNTYHAHIFVEEISGIPFVIQKNKRYSQYFEIKPKSIFKTYYHVSIFEFSQLILLIILRLLGKHGFLFHASGIKTPQGVILFMGPSGAGKSTTLKMLAASLEPFSDDCIAIKKRGNHYHCYQVPWIEKESSFIKKTPAPEKIRHLYVVEKEKSFRIIPLDTTGMLQEIAKNTWTVEGISKNVIFAISDMINSGVSGSKVCLSLHDSQNLLREVSKSPSSLG